MLIVNKYATPGSKTSTRGMMFSKFNMKIITKMAYNQHGAATSADVSVFLMPSQHHSVDQLLIMSVKYLPII